MGFNWDLSAVDWKELALMVNTWILLPSSPSYKWHELSLDKEK